MIRINTMEFLKYERWTDDDVQALLNIYAQDEIQRELEMATCKKSILKNFKWVKRAGHYSHKKTVQREACLHMFVSAVADKISLLILSLALQAF